MNLDDITYEAMDDLSPEGQEILLKHIGTKRHSGRYPYGSGKNPYQRVKTSTSQFAKARAEYKRKGFTDEKFRKDFGMNTSEFRNMVTLVKEQEKATMYKDVSTRLARGESRKSLAEKYGVSLSTIDNYANMEPSAVAKRKTITQISKVLSEKVKTNKYLDVSSGVEVQLGISADKLKAALSEMTGEGGNHKLVDVFVPQVTNPNGGKNTRIKVLMDKNGDVVELMKNKDKIRPVDFSFDRSNINSLQNLQVPKSIDFNRVSIKYAIPSGEKGHGTDADGAMMDGVMVLRPGVKDLSLGNTRYAQVRIAVGGSHYLKGMAIYGEPSDFPKGVDVVFHTNKTKDVPKADVLKELKEPLTGQNPFGATIKRQSPLLDSKGQPVIHERLTKAAKALGATKPVYENGALNIVNEEGDWGDWSKALSSQFLSKQPDRIIKERLQATLNRTDKDYDEIKRVNNPVIKKILLEKYSEELDSKQVHLKAAAPERFQGHVILPLNKIKPNEVYAPGYTSGERVILVRFPHGGTFEIPELIVNNNNPQGNKVISNDSKDAIGIHPKVASKLSGADFDGDTVYVIPNNSGKYKSSKSLAQLKDFDTKDYADEKGTFKPMTKGGMQNHMGVVSNLITDMTLQGATSDELARAVKHSMVVIDAYKHKLNYHRSAEELGIEALKEKYQRHKDPLKYSKMSRVNPRTGKVETVIDPADLDKEGKEGRGGKTLLSRRKQEVTTGGTIVEVPDGKGGIKTVIRNRKKTAATLMLDDARDYLYPDSSKAEILYADYINELKSRKRLVDSELPSIKIPKQDPRAKKIYADEVKSLDEKMKQVLLNRPKERLAQLIATSDVKRYIENLGGDENVSKEDLKKYRNQAIVGARSKVGAHRQVVDITPAEWDAIQANAISANRLRQLVFNMDDVQLKRLATPKNESIIGAAKTSKIKAMINNGYTLKEIADITGVSTSSISKIAKEE